MTGPAILAATTNGFTDFAQNSDDTQERTIPSPQGGTSYVGDYLILITQGDGNATGADLADFTFLDGTTIGVNNELDVYVRQIAGVTGSDDPAYVYTFETVRNVVMALVTLGDQAPDFTGWQVDLDTDFTGSTFHASPGGSSTQAVLNDLGGSVAASSTPGDTVFGLIALAMRARTPTNGSAAYTFLVETSAGAGPGYNGWDTSYADSSTDIHGPTNADVLEWVLWLRGQDARDATVPLELASSDVGLEETDISFNDLTGDATVDGGAALVYPLFSPSTPGSDDGGDQGFDEYWDTLHIANFDPILNAAPCNDSRAFPTFM